MSYILEAIKKAEQERGGSLLPNKPVNSSQQEEKATKSIPWIAIAIFINAIILCAWILFQQFNKSSDLREDNVDASIIKNIELEAVTDEQQSQVPEESLPLEDESVSTNDVNEISNPNFLLEEDAHREINTQQSTEQVVVKSDVPSFFSTATNQVDVKNTLEQSSSIQEESEFSNEKVITDTKQSIDYSETITNTSEDLQRDPPEPLIDPLPDAQESIEQAHSDTYDEPVIDTPQQEVVVAIVENPNVPELGELPFSLQQQIPKIQISVHIYNVAKEARKVRINGGLFLEGDLVDTDLVIEEITAHGVIFDYQGTLFKLSLR